MHFIASFQKVYIRFVSFRFFFLYTANQNGNAISPLHDIPLYADDSQSVYNMVVEVPRWTNAKMEVRKFQNSI